MGGIQLFNLENDPGEKKNLASSNPEMAKRAEQILKTARTINPIFPMTPKEVSTKIVESHSKEKSSRNKKSKKKSKKNKKK